MPLLTRVMLLVLLVPAAGQAADAPSQCDGLLDGRRVTLIVPYAPGGGWDGYARIFEPVFESVTGASLTIRNLVGAGGMRGIRVVAEADPDDLMLGIFNPTALADSARYGLEAPSTDAFLLLGAFLYDADVVAGSRVLVVPDNLPMPLVTGAVDTELTRLMLAMAALDWEIRPVLGFSGSADRWMALLRGDLDIMVTSIESAQLHLAGDPDLQLLLSITDQPIGRHPEVPYLAGEGGLVDRLTAGLPAGERDERLHLARLAVDVGVRARSIAITDAIEGEFRQCLISAVERTMFSEQIQRLASEANLELDPQTSEEVTRTVSKTVAALAENAELIDRVISGN